MKAAAFAARARVRSARAVHGGAVGGQVPGPGLLERGHGGGQRGPGGRAGRGVLVAQQLAGLDVPGQDLGVQQQPAGAELVEQPGGLGRRAQAAGQVRVEGRGEERPAGPGPDRAAGIAGRHAEPGLGGLRGAADQQHRARAHVLLLAQHVRHAVRAVGRERLLGVLEQVLPGRGRDRAHGRRQVQQPAGIEGEPAHHLQRGRGVALAEPHPRQVTGLDDPGPGHVADVQHVRFAAGGAGARRRGDREGPRRGMVDAGRGDADQGPFGIIQGRETATEDTAGVQAQGVVQPLRLRHRRVAVEHQGPAAVLLRPGVPDGQAVLVGLAGGLPVQAELADPAGRAALVALDQAGVGHHQAPAVEHVVADQAVDERLHRSPELSRLGLELFHRGVQAVAALDVLAAQRPQQLGLVVAGHAQRGPGGHHAHDQAQHARRIGAAVHQVAEEHRAPGGVAGVYRQAGAVAVDRVAELAPAGSPARPGSRARRR